MKNRFFLSESARKHVARHFGKVGLAGSHFLPQTFSNPEQLLLYVIEHDPREVIAQSECKAAFCYRLDGGRLAGTSGLGLRKTLAEKDIIREVREGYTLEVGIVEELPLTSDFCIIAQQSPEGLNIITAFPGGYARPFAQKGQPAEEYALNKRFWEEHVLLKQKQA